MGHSSVCIPQNFKPLPYWTLAMQQRKSCLCQKFDLSVNHILVEFWIVTSRPKTPKMIISIDICFVAKKTFLHSANATLSNDIRREVEIHFFRSVPNCSRYICSSDADMCSIFSGYRCAYYKNHRYVCTPQFPQSHAMDANIMLCSMVCCLFIIPNK